MCQPVDVGVNKPLKGKVCAFWEQRMVEKGITDPIAKPPSQADIANWCSVACTQVDMQTIINAWRRTGPHTWFVPTCETRPLGWMERPKEQGSDENADGSV